MLRFVVEIENTIKIFIVVCCTCYCISGRVAEYFDEGVCVCVFVCLSVSYL